MAAFDQAAPVDVQFGPAIRQGSAPSEGLDASSAARSEADIMPAAPGDRPEKMEVAAAAAQAEETDLAKVEAELHRLQTQLDLVQALNEGAAELEEACERSPFELERLRRLPEGVRVDLALALLGTLQHRWKQTAREMPSSSLAHEAPSNHSSAENDARTRLLLGDEVAAFGTAADEPADTFGEALASHTQRTYSAAASALGLSLGRSREGESRRLLEAESVKILPDELPNVATLCGHIKAKLSRGGGAAVWSAESSRELSEEVAASYLEDIRLLDPDVADNVEVAAAMLNQASTLFPDYCCIVWSPGEGTCRLLFQNGQLKKVLARLGVASEAELCQLRPKRLMSLDDFLGELSTSATAPPPVIKQSDGPIGTMVSSSSDPPPELWLVVRELLGVILSSEGGIFDARTRAALLELCGRLGVPRRLFCRWEAEVGSALFEALETAEAVKHQTASRKKWNNGRIAIGAVTGGLLLAVTGGLAAPALAAGVTALGSGLAQVGLVAAVGWSAALVSIGTPGAVVLFGAAGAGLTGLKVASRWGDLEEMSIESLQQKRACLKSACEIADHKVVSKLDAALDAGGGKLQGDHIVTAVGGAEQVLRKGNELVRRECAVGPKGNIQVRFQLERFVDQVQCAAHVAIFVTGWLSTEEGFTRPWSSIASTHFPSSGHLAVRWETEQLTKLRDVFGKLIAKELASQTASLWFKGAAVTAGATAGVAALTIAWPVWIVSAMAGLDNIWLVCVERAKLAGKVLAQTLADRQKVGQRPVTLVGHSMGARMLVYCLLELYKMGCYHVVDDVVLLGTPVTTDPESWRQVRAVASGRVINGYISNDWVLAFLYRYLEWGISVAGLSEVPVQGIENINLTGLGFSGHNEYPDHLPSIFAKIQIGRRGPPADVMG